MTSRPHLGQESCLKSYPESPENTPHPPPTAPSNGSQHPENYLGFAGNGSAGQDSAKPPKAKEKRSLVFFFLFFFYQHRVDREGLVEIFSEIWKTCSVFVTIQIFRSRQFTLNEFYSNFFNSFLLDKSKILNSSKFYYKHFQTYKDIRRILDCTLYIGHLDSIINILLCLLYLQLLCISNSFIRPSVHLFFLKDMVK